MEPDQIDFRDVADNATRSVLVRLYAYIGKLLRAVNSGITPPPAGAWQDVASGVGFQNAWANVGAGNELVAFRFDSDGTVRIRGFPTNPGAGINLPMFTLPGAYRPPSALYFPCVSGGAGGTPGFVKVKANGDVEGWANAGTFAMDGITFSTL